MSKKAKVIRVKPTEPKSKQIKKAPQTELAVTEAVAMGTAEQATTEEKTPAVATRKILSLHQVGYDEGYKDGLNDGTTKAIIGFVATVEQKLAEHDGYRDPLKWRREATIPAWWIAVLISELS